MEHIKIYGKGLKERIAQLESGGYQLTVFNAEDDKPIFYLVDRDVYKVENEIRLVPDASATSM